MVLFYEAWRKDRAGQLQALSEVERVHDIPDLHIDRVRET